MREAPFLMRIVTGVVNRLQGHSPEQSAEGLAQLAAGGAQGKSGQFFRGTTPVTAPAGSLDESAQERLWAISAGLTRLKDS
jgi:hypothetical protein